MNVHYDVCNKIHVALYNMYQIVPTDLNKILLLLFVVVSEHPLFFVFINTFLPVVPFFYHDCERKLFAQQNNNLPVSSFRQISQWMRTWYNLLYTTAVITLTKFAVVPSPASASPSTSCLLTFSLTLNTHTLAAQSPLHISKACLLCW